MVDQLWNPERHEALADRNWDATYVNAWLHALVHEVTAIYEKDGGWPVHPRDAMDGITSKQATSMYYGSGGVIWALQRLQTVLNLPVPMDLRSAALRCHQIAQREPDVDEPGLLLSKGGTELLAYGFGFDEAREALTASIRACGALSDPKELLWGPPAALLMAWHAYQLNRDPHWLQLFHEYGARFLQNFGLEKRERWTWPQQLYGADRPCIGAGHGFVGGMLPYSLAYEVLPEEQRRALFDNLISCVQDTALQNSTEANWAKRLPTPDGEPPEYLLQWCHGAPGIVSSLSYLPQSEFKKLESLLIKAGEAIWAAGPLVKPSGLCHGTAGNGYAFLRLHARTGNRLWLDRARAFATHAIRQANTERQIQDQGYFSLMTGDLGLAVYLADCLVAGPGYLPVVESFT